MSGRFGPFLAVGLATLFVGSIGAAAWQTQMPAAALCCAGFVIGVLIALIPRRNPERAERDIGLSKIVSTVSIVGLVSLIFGPANITTRIDQAIVKVAPFMNCATDDACHDDQNRVIGGRQLPPLAVSW